MNHITTLAEVSERVQKMSENYYDEMIPVKDVSFHNLSSIQIGDQSHPLQNIAARQISTRLGVPYSYLERCDPDLQANNLNKWLPKERNKDLFVRFEANTVRAIFTPRYVPLDNVEVLQQVNESYQPNTDVQCHLDDGLMLLNIPDVTRDFEIGKRDRHLPGISISNSEVGLASFSLAAFILRLVCTNGMVLGEKVGTNSFRHVSSKALDDFPALLSNAQRNLVNSQEYLTLSLNSPIEDPQATLESFGKQFQLIEMEREAITWAWPYEQGDNMFNIVQTFTKAAQYPSLPAESAFKLQKTGGRILSMVKPGGAA